MSRQMLFAFMPDPGPEEPGTSPAPHEALNVLWRQYRRALGSLQRTLESLRAQEQQHLPCEDYLSLFGRQRRLDIDEAFVETARAILDRLVKRAAEAFGPPGSPVPIDRKEIAEAFPISNEAQARRLSPAKVWAYLEARFGGGTGERMALTECADALIRKLGLREENTIRTVGRFTVLDFSVWSVKRDSGRRTVLSDSSSTNVAQAFGALEAFAGWAQMPELAQACEAAARRWTDSSTDLVSRQKFSLGNASEYVTYFERFEIRFGPEVVEALQRFVSEFGSEEQ